MTRPAPIQIGEIIVEPIVEMEFPFETPAKLYPDATAEIIEAERHWLEPWALCPETGKIIIAVQSYLVRTEHHTVLIDTCVGCDKTSTFLDLWHRRSDRGWLDRLAAAGARPEDVDYVMCTHLHSDHCGWNTRLLDGRWVPTFPNARYVMAKVETDHFSGLPGPQYRESVLPVIEAGQALLVDTDHTLDDHIRFEPTPGHTPGHVAVGLASQGAEAVMCGDLMHSPIQCKYPDWSYGIDFDPDQARTTRRRFLEDCAATGRLVLTAHFPAPSVGRVEAAGGTFAFRFL